MIQFLNLFLKGIAMGTANVIPGVSGGTIALITGIYEKLIDSIKSFDIKAIQLLLKFNFKEFWSYVNGSFLVSVFTGIAVSVVTLAKVLEYLLENYQVWTMAFFFGLILISIYYVGKTVTHWSLSSIVSLIVGTSIAVGIALLAPAGENAAFTYVFLCGVVAICSMILPGLSGSFVLIIMGNYALILKAVGSAELNILIPLALGCAFGLIAFSHLLSWIFKRFHNETIALMTGFILGSMAIIWPWKNANTEVIQRSGKPDKEVITGFEWYLPELNTETFVAVGLILLGILTLWLVEKSASTKTKDQGSVKEAV